MHDVGALVLVGGHNKACVIVVIRLVENLRPLHFAKSEIRDAELLKQIR